MTTNKKEFTFDRVVRIIFTAAIAAGAIWIISLLKDVLLPFLVACLIAYLLEPFVQHNRKLLHLKGRIAAIFITLFEAVFLFGIVIYFVSPAVMNEVSEMSNILRQYTTTELSGGGFIPEEIHQFLKEHLDAESLSKLLTRDEWISIFEN